MDSQTTHVRVANDNVMIAKFQNAVRKKDRPGIDQSNFHAVPLVSIGQVQIV